MKENDKRKKRILLVSCEGLGNGGVQAVLMGIVRNLYQEFQFDILLFTSEKRYYDDEFEKYGGHIYRIPRYEGENKYRRKLDYYVRGFSLYHKLVRLLIENAAFDVIHCNDEYESAILLKAAYKVGISTRIVHTHVVSSEENFLVKYINNHRRRIIEKYATKKIGCSREACESFYLNSDNTEVFNNFYDDNKFIFNAEIGKVETLNLIQIGMFSENKNQLFALEVIYEIRKQIEDCKLVIVGFGEGAYKRSIENRIQELKLERNVEVYPSNADTPSILNESFALICPSVKEGFGIVLLEAQAMGVRCFASTGVPKTTNCGGVTFIDLKYGAEVWANAIIKSFLEYGNVKQFFDVSDFTALNVMGKYKSIYEGVQN